MVTNRAQQEIIWIQPKKFKKLLRRLAPLTFLIRVQAFGDQFCGELPHVQIFMNDGPDPIRSREMSSCSAIDLAEIRPSGLPRLAREFDQLSPGWSLFWVVLDEAHHR